MRFLTRKFAEDKLDSFKADLQYSVYLRHLDEIKTDLPSSVAGFAFQAPGFGLRGLRLTDVLEDAGLKTLNLTLDVPNDEPQLFVEIIYSGVNIDGIEEGSLAKIEEQESELLADEFDLAPQDRFEHRLLFAPDGEIAVQFRGFEVKVIRPDDSDSDHSEHQ